MRRLLYSLLIVFVSPCTFAQGDMVDEVVALRQSIEDQNGPLNDQSAQLASLTQRVAELGGRTGLVDVPAPGISISTTGTVPPYSPPDSPGRTAATEAGEISLQHKRQLRTGIETQIVDDAVVLSEIVDLYGSLRIFAVAGADDLALNDGKSR